VTSGKVHESRAPPAEHSCLVAILELQAWNNIDWHHKRLVTFIKIRCPILWLSQQWYKENTVATQCDEYKTQPIKLMH